MIARPLKIAGAWLIESAVAQDPRGSFATVWDLQDEGLVALAFKPESVHHASNERAGTLRGLHFQRAPHAQAKLVSCAAGRLWDVILDLRPESGTHGQWVGTSLAAGSGHSILVPRGCAHGYVTLEDQTVVTYLIEGDYHEPSRAVVRWNDPAFGIEWPVDSPQMSERDRTAPDHRP